MSLAYLHTRSTYLPICYSMKSDSIIIELRNGNGNNLIIVIILSTITRITIYYNGTKKRLCSRFCEFDSCHSLSLTSCSGLHDLVLYIEWENYYANYAQGKYCRILFIVNGTCGLVSALPCIWVVCVCVISFRGGCGRGGNVSTTTILRGGWARVPFRVPQQVWSDARRFRKFYGFWDLHTPPRAPAYYLGRVRVMYTAAKNLWLTINRLLKNKEKKISSRI